MEVGSFILLFSSVVSQGSYARMPCGTLLASAVLAFEMNFQVISWRAERVPRRTCFCTVCIHLHLFRYSTYTLPSFYMTAMANNHKGQKEIPRNLGLTSPELLPLVRN